MNKYIFYSNERLKGKIEFKKIGLIFRNLNDEESNLIIDNYRKIIINKKIKIWQKNTRILERIEKNTKEKK